MRESKDGTKNGDGKLHVCFYSYVESPPATILASSYYFMIPEKRCAAVRRSRRPSPRRSSKIKIEDKDTRVARSTRARDDSVSVASQSYVEVRQSHQR